MYGEDDIQVQLMFCSTFEEGKHRLRGEPMVVALWEGQAWSGRSETEVLQMAVMQEGARRGHATRTKRRRNAPQAAAAQ